MRHGRKTKHLGRDTGHRLALRRSLINALLTHERIVTTEAKAKTFRRDAEKIITLARKAEKAVREAKPDDASQKAAKALRLHYIRLAISRLDKRKLYDRNSEPVTTEKNRIRTVIQKLFEDLGPRYLNRQGGYTRIIKLPNPRLNDCAPQVVWELVDSPVAVLEKNEPKKK